MEEIKQVKLCLYFYFIEQCLGQTHTRAKTDDVLSASKVKVMAW